MILGAEIGKWLKGKKKLEDWREECGRKRRTKVEKDTATRSVRTKKGVKIECRGTGFYFRGRA